uniref:Transporter n=1 Tax=Macrostomum lignano TaxID=282301 RepID=A0A1I8J7H8_9PLAT
MKRVAQTFTGLLSCGQRFRTQQIDIQMNASNSAEAPQAGEGEAADENEARGNWTGQFDFLLSCIGYAVGLGNVWRFPYLCYKNGGGAFLIPYLIMLGVAALPLFYMEVAFGQFGNLGPVTIWKACPLLKGTGWAMVSISALVSIYYNVIIAWALFYLFASFNSKVPWADCNNYWNDFHCRDLSVNTTNATHNVPGNLRAGFNPNPEACSQDLKTNCTQYQTPSEQYFERVMLGYTSLNGAIKKMSDPIGPPQWHVTLCLLLAWIIIYACLLKGVKTSGKVVYFTATFPYLVLVILLIRGATLEGAKEGIIFYLKPDFSLLLTSEIWSAAAVQIFYSLGVAFGCLTTMSSYNKFRNNCYKDALIVAGINSGTSIFAGFAIFSVIGFMAHKTGLPVAEVTKSGPGLAFVAYPEGLAAMPVAPLWSVLFFIMILTLGVDSQFAMVETVLTACMDEWPWLQENFTKQAIFKSVVCLVMFLLGIPMCCPGGIYYFSMLNDYCAYYNLFVVALVEMLGISYLYGIKNFLNDIQMMLGFRPGPYWIACWFGITPALILFIAIFSLVKYQSPSYNSEPFTIWGEAMCWLMMVGSVLFIPCCGIYEVWRRGGLTAALKETPDWGPPVEAFWLESDKYREKLKQMNTPAKDGVTAGVENQVASTVDPYVTG